MHRLKLYGKQNFRLRILVISISLLVLSTVSIYILDKLLSFHHDAKASFVISPAKIKHKNIKDVLLWPPGSQVDPINRIRNGRSSLLQNHCTYKNCFFTRDINCLNSIQFDAIAFNAFDNIRKSLLPIFFEERDKNIKYIFASLESPVYYPVNSPKFDDFFNWTWTYRLDSDIPFTYFTIHDTNDRIIGPSVNMEWYEKMKPVSRRIRKEIDLKTKAVAWIVSNCGAENKREFFVASLDLELLKYDLKVDMYGQCSIHNKRIDNINVIDDYYFYLAFENSMDRDYVTEKVMNALDHLAIPVVYGGANYSRFLPPNSYIDATKLSPKVLAKTIKDLLENKTALYDFFRWKRYYKYKENLSTGVCSLCAALNNREMTEAITTYPYFREWWNNNRSHGTKPKSYMSLIFNLLYDWIYKVLVG